jgi:hypothetical protein
LADSSYDELFARLQAIVESSFYDPAYSLYGNYFLTEPPEFNFMSKGISMGRRLAAETFSTKITAKLFRLEGKTKISIQTSTNPVFFVMLAACMVSALIQTIQFKGGRLEIILGNLAAALIILGIDRFVKNMLVAAFEEDAKI